MTNQRASYHFPREAANALADIMANTRLENAAATVRVALASYRDLLEVTRAGCKIIVRDKAGVDYAYSLFAPFSYPGFDRLRVSNSIVAEKAMPPRNLFFSTRAVEELTVIRKLSFAQSNADAIRIALASLSELVRVLSSGDDIIIVDRWGNEVRHDPRAPLVRDGLDLTPSEPRLSDPDLPNDKRPLPTAQSRSVVNAEVAS